MLALLNGVTAADTPPLEFRIEQAVMASDVDALRQHRDRLADGGSRYTLAYVDWRLWRLVSEQERKTVAEEAERVLGSLLAERPDDAEALALLGSVYGMQITGMFSGMKLGPKASEAHDRAAELAPENPRVALQRGISASYKPGAFGGGVEAAERELRKAIALFESESDEKAWPNWGRAEVHAWLGQVLARKNDTEGARAAYKKGLSLAPDYRWIRDELLPALGE